MSRPAALSTGPHTASGPPRSRSPLSLFFALGLLTVGALAWGAPEAAAVDYDCDNFSTQAAAQVYLVPGDPYRLDADGDGIACESLPCPCSALSGGGDDGSGDDSRGSRRLEKSVARRAAVRKARNFVRRNPSLNSVSLRGCARRSRSRVDCNFLARGKSSACRMKVVVQAAKRKPVAKIRRIRCR